MRTRDRNREEQQRTQDTGGATTVGNDDRGGDDLRHRARRLLELGDETISNALSHNSERFLEQNRQQGGE
jgi:hypothetical protein